MFLLTAKSVSQGNTYVNFKDVSGNKDEIG